MTLTANRNYPKPSASAENVGIIGNAFDSIDQDIQNALNGVSAAASLANPNTFTAAQQMDTTLKVGTSTASGCLSVGSTTPDAAIFGISINRVTNTSSSNTAFAGQWRNSGTGDTRGISYTAIAGHAAGTMSSLIGGYFYTRTLGLGLVTNSQSMIAASLLTSATTVSSHKGVTVENPAVSGGGVITTNYAIHIDAQTAGATNWGLYQAGTANNALGGSLSVGHTGTPTAPVDISGNRLRLRTAKTPASAADTGNAGEFCWDSSYLYMCVAANTWKRAPIATW